MVHLVITKILLLFSFPCNVIILAIFLCLILVHWKSLFTACLTDPESEKFLLWVHRVSGFTSRVNPGFSKILSGLRVSVSGFLLFLPGFLWNRSRVCGFKPGADFWDRVGPGWLIFPPGWTRAGSVRQAVLTIHECVLYVNSCHISCGALILTWLIVSFSFHYSLLLWGVSLWINHTNRTTSNTVT